MSSISQRFTSSVGFAALITGVFAIATTLAAWIAVSLHKQELVQRLFFDTQYQAESLQRVYQHRGLEELLSQIDFQLTYDDQGAMLVAFHGKNGAHVGDSFISEPFVHQRVLQVGKDITLPEKIDEESDGTYFGYGVETPDGWILVARDSRWVTDSQEVLEQSILWGLAASMVLIALVVFYIARFNERRVQSIRSVLTKAAAGNMAARCEVSPDTGDALNQVSVGINQTLDHLQRSMESLRQVSADIAHDLRRPLTRLRLKLEQVQLQGNLDPPNEGEIDSHLESGILATALDDIDQVSTTFDAILRLAQIESGAQTIARKPVDLVQLSHELYDLFVAVAEDNQQTLTLQIQCPAVFVNGDIDLIRQAVINLLDNSIRYAEPNANIILRCGVDDDRRYIQVQDNGPGIRTELHEKVTDRFFRVDSSRHLAGTGLGLSLVKAIAQRHDAELRLEDGKPGLAVTVIWRN
ncbi:hypothetical protein FJM67_08080 [Maribrevibacterium harenarium]|uniref:histidine kinase n=1 Tax=Maribrevibacterium harenarium TaxID=2589817 RepID=A0A501WY20_9GAMM|nr:ATP-binding protein [Maribrevibacterium harenarium]TPE52387.1 hypothetical protein FJM67_08080 [Maribrevibacterium harenarium]